MNLKLKLVGFLVAFILASFTLVPPSKTTIYLIGDSTMSDKNVKAYPEAGWGMPFRYFFDSTVVVDNRAMNGRSTRTFMEENRWAPVVDKLEEGDYVFIQFGHNDEVQTKRSATKPEEFRSNLIKYVTDTRSKKAQPVLITPVARRNFDSTGVFKPTHEEYSAIVRQVAKDQKVPLIDLDRKSQALLVELGAEKSKFFFNHLKAGEHPNYPKGKIDDTHFNELGARLMAQLVLKEIQELKLEIADKIVRRN
ncbi:rhamnogalacturonan acetylesterase [Pedobacter sp. SYSU D00535]|uniref:rhamnogalacturonan acetylesterase n=1 Tax=Pedobacter sp. SYSU D00535 TaxID=2810308 RepID=UPI001A972839|nr:rhamnogalacturonan acetylesterase [Pedobacter sp. SYSU D00535]